jgi:hypothetical protein
MRLDTARIGAMMSDCIVAGDRALRLGLSPSEHERRTRMTSRLQSLMVAGAVVGGLSCSGPAAGDVTAAFIDGTTYSYSISHVPDLDQRRLLIPNSGSAYCVPTATMNWMMYFANHGAEWIAPGPGNWQSQTFYNEGTNAIIALGDLMGTHEINGTNANGASLGIFLWVPPFAVSTVHQLPDANWTPGFQNASEAVLNGGYCVVIVGWYQEFPFDPDYIDRQGGHALTLNGGARSGEDMLISWRDPSADEGDSPVRLILQSPFTTQEYAIDRVWRVTADIGGNHRWMDKVIGYGGNNQGYIDEVLALYPNFALTSQPDSQALFTWQQVHPIWGGYVGDQEYEIAPDAVLRDLSLNPDLCSAVYVVAPPGEPGEVRWLNLVTHEWLPVEYPFDGPRAAFVAPDRALFVQIGNDTLLRMNVDLDEPELEEMLEVPCAVHAMTYDDAADEVVLFSASCETVYRYPRTLADLPEVLPVNPGFPIEPDDCRLAIDPRTGNVWVCSSASESLYELVLEPAGDGLVPEEVHLPTVTEPQALAFGNGGRLYVSSNGQIMEYEYLPDENEWVEIAEPLTTPICTTDRTGTTSCPTRTAIRGRRTASPTSTPTA